MSARAARIAKRERMPAHGSSMFPFVPAGSTLELRARTERAVRVGDIVCYPGPHGEVIAHRVLACDHATHTERVWITRGDALDAMERIPESAIGWVVERVSRGRFGYRTDGLLGRALARIAVRRGLAYRASARAARIAVRARRVRHARRLTSCAAKRGPRSRPRPDR